MHDDERSRLLDVLRATPTLLPEALDGVDDELVRWRPAPGKWSIVEILCHMRDMERDAYLARYRRILAEERPALPDIDGDRCALEGGYRDASPATVLSDWNALRAESLALLATVSGDAWLREGVHEGIGPLSMEGYLRRQALGNDEAHLGQIRAIRERRDLFRRLEAGPDRLAGLLDGLSGDRLRGPSPSGKWGVAENACHLRDTELLFVERFTRMAFQERPQLWMPDNDAVAASRRYREADMTAVVAELRALRADTLALLRSLPSAVWQRTGLHPKRGEISIARLAEIVAQHDDSHLGRIAELRETRAAG